MIIHVHHTALVNTVQQVSCVHVSNLQMRYEHAYVAVSQVEIPITLGPLLACVYYHM